MTDTVSPKTMILQACRALFAPVQVVELRVLGIGSRDNHPASGWFSDFERLAECAANIETHGKPDGIYVTLNPVNSACMARSPNELRDYMKVTTSDRDITCRHWLPIDVDPVRPSGVSASDAELAAAREVASRVRRWLETELHFPSGIRAASGNGFHLLYRVDLPNTDEATAIIKDCLAAIDRKFSGDGVKIDRSNCNAARIFKLYGTLARKGHDMPDRPHRRSRLVHADELPVFGEIAVASNDNLEALAFFGRECSQPPPRRSTSGGSSGGGTSRASVDPPVGRIDGKYAVDLDAFIEQHRIAVLRREPFDETGLRYILRCCIFDPNHGGTSAALGRSKNGKIFYKCQHDSCAGRDWDQVKEHFEQVGSVWPPHGSGRANAKKTVKPSIGKPAGDSGVADENPWDLARQILDELFTDTDTGHVTMRRHHEEFFEYRIHNRCYKPLVSDDVSVIVTRWLGDQGVGKVTTKLRNDVINSLAAKVTVPADMEAPCMSRIDPETACLKFESTGRNRITMKNGILDLDAMLAGKPVEECLLGHTPEWFATSALPFAFPICEEETVCPTWMAFLRQIFQNEDGTPDESRIAILQEAFGYCFLRFRALEKFFVLHGAGRNGKSTVLNVLRTLLGEENVASLSLEEFGVDYYLQRLQNKMANLCSDMNEMDRLQEGILKSVVSGDLISARRLYKDPIQFRPHCACWFATNVLPRFQDTSLGIWRRMLLIPFDYVVPQEAVDVLLLSKLESEMSGILFWAMQGATRVHAEKRFTSSSRCEQASREFQLKCFPILLFLDECTQDAGSVQAGTLWNTYRRWCTFCGLRMPKPLHQFVSDVLGFRTSVSFDREPGSMEHKVELLGLSIREGLCMDVVTPSVLPSTPASDSEYPI